MNILTRYFLSILIPSILAVMAFFAALDFFIGFMGLVKSNSGTSFTEQVIPLLLMLPNKLYHFSPLLIMIGSFIGQAMIAHHFEWIALKSLGMTLKKAVVTLAGIGSLFGVSTLLGGEFLATTLEHLSIRMEQEAIKIPMQLTEKGFWLRQGNHFWYIAQLLPNELRGVTTYDFKEEQLVEVRYAERAEMQGENWQLFNVVETHLGTSITSSHQNTMVVTAPIGDATLKPFAEQSQTALKLSELWRIYYFQHTNHLNELVTLIPLLQRILNFIFIILLTVYPLRFVMGLPRQMHLGRRIAVGLIIGFLFYSLVGAAASYIFMLGVPLLLGITVPFLLLVIGVRLYFYRWSLMT